MSLKVHYCNTCNKNITEKEYKYSIENYDLPLCRKHQKESSSGELITDGEKGLSDKKKKNKEGMIKGRIAETLIEELFLSSNYNVYKYGMENRVVNLKGFFYQKN